LRAGVRHKPAVGVTLRKRQRGQPPKIVAMVRSEETAGAVSRVSASEAMTLGKMFTSA